MDIVSAKGESVPGIVGITTETFGAAPAVLRQIPGKAKVAELKKGERTRFANGTLFIVSYPRCLEKGCLAAVPRGSMNRPASSWEIMLGGPAVWTLLPETVSWGVQKDIGWKKERIYKKSVQGGRIAIPGHNGKAGDSYGIPNAVVIQTK